MMIEDRKYMTSDILIANGIREDAQLFQLRFSRCRQLLRFIATRVLGGSERVEDAIENCWRTVSPNPLHFEHESAFRSWLLRVLIDEALAIRNHNQEAPRVEVHPRRDFFGARDLSQENKMWLAKDAAEGEY